MKRLLLLLLVLFTTLCVNAQLKLPGIIRDSMIMQRDVPVKIWGWAAPNEKVKIVFKKKSYSVKADAKGNWVAVLNPTPAGGPHAIDISTAKSRITIREILFGEVWFCSGQSNMVHQLDIHDVTYEKEIAAANNAEIRQFWVPDVANVDGPQADISGGYWKSAVGDDVRPFSAVAYFFALKLYEKYKVPVGIINSSVGGTPIEAWTSEEGLKNFPTHLAMIAENKNEEIFKKKTVQAPPAPRPEDAGLGSPAWYDPAYQPKGWRPINVPGYWEDQGLRDLNGVVWYRRTIELTEEMAKSNSRIHLGRIVDADEVYVNGIKVGSTGYLYPQRRYRHVSQGTWKVGSNTIVIRVTNTKGKGGFVPDKPYMLVIGKDTVDLKGTWQYKVGSAFSTEENSEAIFRPNRQPTALFNAMVAPLIYYTIKGICWYQGEANTGNPAEYRILQPAMIHDWRKQWNEPTLPFIFAQLPGYLDYKYLPSESKWAWMRESQAASLEIPNTAMAVTIDLGEWNDIHPENKKDVGERMALAAMNMVYKEKLVSSGPLVDTAIVYNDRIEITFKHIGSGLTTSDGEPPADFAIAGSDKKFVWAKTRIDGNKIIAWSPEVANPAFVRYAWADNPVNANVINKEGLPASPFRTDN